ncbi:Di-/tripeptide transporter [Flavobacterium saliperosum S13]|uniref:Proton-dependent oligopeptide transporter, POT family n=2 Tax=Flavobacterium saliperosum TaxID=329186 RepID=A0A1G4VWC9_9FLAO|nr:peptide MFS transporter [Flavobacterium saliperosum]ESU26780.1 Di-/tripeptide transporter [Flavobacterium saliperosum S13]SCX12926.1 proton-dependent oligopeptide transporter, POT family [Flavobacterium saliperosum]
MSATIEQIQNFKGKYPKQLWYLFFSEMWERFSFYGMRGMLVVFMVNQLMMDEKTANLQYGATQAFVYAFTFIGGLFADKILGYRKSLFWGGLLMIVGSIILAIDPKQFFFFGISFTIIGTGFFKPNISTMVGKLYKDDDNRRDAGFSLFYAGVNLGALIGGYICIAVANGNMFASFVPEHLRWNVAFGFAAIVMIISLLTFTQTQKSLGEIGLSPLNHLEPSKKRTLEIVTYVGSLVIIPIIMTMVARTEYTDYFMFVIGPASLLYLFYEMRNFSLAENKKLFAALVFIIFSIFFWAFFEQSGGSLSLFAANNLENTVAGIKLDPNGVNNSANSLFVIAFAALVGMAWLWMNKRKIEPNTVVKFGLAFIFLAGGFYVFYYTKFFADASGRTSLDLFTFGWFVITFGELCLSPIGMSAMTKLSPQKTQAVIMGMWFLASAYGQYFAGLLGANIAEASENASNLEKLNVYADGYEQLAIYALIAGVVLIAISPFVKKLMGEVK